MRGKALAIGGRSSEAVSELERAARGAIAEGDLEAAADALDGLCWIAWIELDGKRMRQYAKSLLETGLPQSSGEAFRIYIRRATRTLQLGDAQSAKQLLDEAENVSRIADIDAFSAYLTVKGDVLAALGETDVAVHHVRLGVEIAHKRPDRYSLWLKLIYLGWVLYASGQTEAALDVLFETLHVARALNLSWEVPLTLSRAAYIAFLLGRLAQARELIAETLSFDAEQRWMYVLRSAVGLMIGLATGDKALQRLAFDERVPSYAFGSADAYSIGPVAAAYHAYYCSIGRDDVAAEILHRGVTRLPSPDCGWQLLQAVALCGEARDVEKAERLVAMFPKHHPVALAHSLLFESAAAARRGERANAERLAGEAQSAFEQCGWMFAAARCVEMTGRIGEARRLYASMGAHADAARLSTARARPGRPRRGYECSRQRQEILRMIARGATNLAIADRLGVSPRTVKYRISELYAAAGVVSRRELLALIASGSIVLPHS